MGKRSVKEAKKRTKVTEEVKSKVRAMYILGRYTSLEELADTNNVSISWLYTTKARENWDLLKTEVKEDNIVDVVSQELSQVVGSIEFYDKVMRACNDLLDKSISSSPRLVHFKGTDVETLAPLSPQEIKALIEAYKLAEDSKLLLLSVKVRGEEENG